MTDFLTVDSIKTLTDTGFTFIFGMVALYAASILARYITKSLEQKENQITEERKARDELSHQTLEVVRNNTEGFREMVGKLTDFMQEGRTHHKEVMSHLAHITSDRGFNQQVKPNRKRAA
jgi:hypothetical protein